VIHWHFDDYLHIPFPICVLQLDVQIAISLRPYQDNPTGQ
jgi:hypothetical protein